MDNFNPNLLSPEDLYNMIQEQQLLIDDLTKLIDGLGKSLAHVDKRTYGMEIIGSSSRID